jgi:lauroyl/myristoyl acyltransferase
MPAADSATHEPKTHEAPPAMGLHDAFWTRLILFLMRWLPATFFIWITYPAAVVVYLLGVKPREAIRANLRALLPGNGSNSRAVYQVFLQYGFTYLDRLWHLYFQREIDWEILGEDDFDELQDKLGGALIFTVHSGNYDIGASLFARKFRRPIHTVRMPEASASLQKLRGEELRAEERREPNLHVHYNEPGGHLGMELCRLLLAGEVVCVQGDRVMGDVTPTQASIDGVTYRLPRGPLVLAEVTGVPCYFVFLTRRARLSYRIEIGKPFYPGGRKGKADEIGAAWLEVMHPFLLRHWDQWFVFEPLVTRDPA